MPDRLRRIAAAAALPLTAVFGLLVAPAQAQQALPTPVAPVAAPAPEVAHPALWKVSDADTTIYLFGTIHALPEGIDWFGGPVATAFEGSDELVTEIVQSSPESMQSVVLAKAIQPPGQALRAQLSKSDRAAFDKAMMGFGLPVTAFDRFKPWYAAIALATLPIVQGGFASDQGVEAVLDARAKALSRSHSALETAEFQLGLFDSLPPAVQCKYLREVIDDLPSIRTELETIVGEWKQGHADRLAELMNEDEDDPAMIATLITNRNRTWSEWIRKRLDTPGTVFVAVGAGHLAGKDSVQDFLAKAGVQSARVQ